MPERAARSSTYAPERTAGIPAAGQRPLFVLLLARRVVYHRSPGLRLLNKPARSAASGFQGHTSSSPWVIPLFKLSTAISVWVPYILASAIAILTSGWIAVTVS